MKVYVAIKADYADTEVLGVFAERETAEAVHAGSEPWLTRDDRSWTENGRVMIVGYELQAGP